MTIPVSSVPAAEKAILAAVQAQLTAANDTSVMVFVGTPGPNLPTDIIEVGYDVKRSLNVENFIGNGGVGWLDESYDIDVMVSVARETISDTTDPLALVDRAWVLVGFIETGVRTDPSLGGAVTVAYPVSSSGGRPAWGTGTTPGRVCEITVTIHCEALI